MPVRALAAAASALILVACSGSASVAGQSETTTTTTAVSTSDTTPSSGSSTTTTQTTQGSISTSSTTDDDGEAFTPPIPTHTDDDALELAVSLNVDRLLVADGPDQIAVSDGIATRKSDVSAWSDGKFLYWDEHSFDQTTGVNSFVRSVAATFDWTVVCEFDEWDIHHVTERSDGSLVAGVERPWDWEGRQSGSAHGDPVEVPAFAVECSDGSSQPIASFRRSGGDGDWLGVERVADRVFTFQGDAEGNANYFTEDGIVINGDDIVGSMLFADDGSDAVYQIYVGGWAAAPALSVRKVDTVTADVLWTREFVTPISSLDYDGERVLVGLVPEGEQWLGYGYSTDRIVVLDGSGGQVIDEVPTSLWVHYAG